jgi:hypothetical protein
MNHRPTNYRPSLEPLERKQLLSAGPAPAQSDLATGHAAIIASDPPPRATAAASGRVAHPSDLRQPTTGFLVYRVTNPNRFNNHIRGPLGHVLVQVPQPVPGQHYNILYVAVRNGTAQTFDASSGFRVSLTGLPTSFPIMTGDQQWKPGQWYVFYILSKKYYPLPSQTHAGFTFLLGGARSVAIPGPSGIFLRVKYNPQTINNLLDFIVTKGAGAQGGKGLKYGMPDTAIDEFVSAKTRRNDYGGYF